ncbi:GTP1 OBG domain-containing protein [Rutstroemia sp. NJR-2017a WRK4]|nr:GTP1 OBG domain-containing protein [Rutstroemia sp. NJR-2017a WRK4]
MSEEVSHGRGGAGNIGVDTTPYADGEIVREGPAGDHGDGAFSTGRGGAANIGSPGLPATKRNDADSIPETALRPSMDGERVHFGRGGEGNVVDATPKGQPHPVGLADKLKNKLFKKKAQGAEK